MFNLNVITGVLSCTSQVLTFISKGALPNVIKPLRPRRILLEILTDLQGKTAFQSMHAGTEQIF
jgi:hypothetical protein